ncbi:MAG: hypothetical protein ABIK65_12405 [Candidatus Eisenbacteria bacterium]
MAMVEAVVGTKRNSGSVPEHPGRSFRWEVAAVILIALLVRLPNLGHTPFVDELNHVLAARSFVEDGEMRLPGGGGYGRAKLFTHAVAALFRIFGESLAVARIPALLAGVALVTALFLWLRRNAGVLAAWIGALLFCFYPESIYLSQISRFYTLQALFLWIGATQIYRIAEDPENRETWLRAGAISVVSLLLAVHFQLLSLIGAGCVAVWAGAALAPWIGAKARTSPRPAFLFAALLAAAALVLFLAWRSGRVAGLWDFYRNRADLWAAGSGDSRRFYHWILLGLYPTIWPLFPFLAIFALLRRPRPASFAVTVFVLVFLIQSGASWKAERYLFYAMPYFFGAVGIALSDLISLTAGRWAEGIRSLAGRRSLPMPAGRIATVLVAGALLIAALWNDATPIAWKMLTEEDARWNLPQIYRGEPDWVAAEPTVRPYLDEGAALVASSALKALWAWGRIDYILSRDRLNDVGRKGPRKEMENWWKIARPVLSEVPSLERITAEHPLGIVVIEQGSWRKSWGVPPAVADWLDANLRPLPFAPEWRLHGFYWDHRADRPSPAPRS